MSSHNALAELNMWGVEGEEGEEGGGRRGRKGGGECGSGGGFILCADQERQKGNYQEVSVVVLL